jgi:hypothetical protein
LPAPATPPAERPTRATKQKAADGPDDAASPATAAAGTPDDAAPPVADALPGPSEAARAPKEVATPTEAPAPGDASQPPKVAAPAPTGDLAVLRDRWPEVVARVSANPPAKPLIAECRPISVEDGVVTLGFPESKAFLKDLLDKRRNILEENISAVLGRSVAVRCVATNIDVLPDLPTDDEAAWILAEARRIFGEEGAGEGADPAEVG